jgi:hypothetical protein
VKRGLFVSLVSLALLSFASPAFADGGLTIKDVTIPGPVTVEVRLGTGIASESVPAATASLKKGENLKLDSTNLQFFWRREANPGSGDGKWTDWQRVDPRSGDQTVEI